MEDHLEVLALPRICHVDHTIRLHFLQPVLDRRQIGTIVAVPAIRLDSHQRKLLPTLNDLRSITFFHHPFRRELLHNVGDARVVETLALLDESRTLKAVIDHLELNARDIAQGLPALKGVRVPRLKGDNRRTRSFFELCVFVESFLRLLIERGQITDVWRLLVEVGVGSPEMVDQHPELCTPVSDMVDAVDPVSAKLQHSADRLPDDG
mmetsp:Transcript_15717/g.52616  ORF Transcript_15717/g.52616 Transcript_15717/m.52616 type:complete len:208 (-) Transcript_15717:557-1180(-)